MVSWGLDMSVQKWRLRKGNIMGREGGGIRIVAAYADDFTAIGFDRCHCWQMVECKYVCTIIACSDGKPEGLGIRSKEI